MRRQFNRRGSNEAELPRLASRIVAPAGVSGNRSGDRRSNDNAPFALSILAQSSSLETSADTALAIPPPPPIDARISADAASACAKSRAAIKTLAPLLAKMRAIPLPIPLLPPVTMTERPESDVSTIRLF